jgi:hypothetical protein
LNSRHLVWYLSKCDICGQDFIEKEEFSHYILKNKKGWARLCSKVCAEKLTEKICIALETAAVKSGRLKKKR